MVEGSASKRTFAPGLERLGHGVRLRVTPHRGQGDGGESRRSFVGSVGQDTFLLATATTSLADGTDRRPAVDRRFPVLFQRVSLRAVDRVALRSTRMAPLTTA